MSAVRTALYGVLAADPTLTGLLASPDAIYHRRAPQDAATPFVVFDKSAGAPEWSFTGDPLERTLWMVKGVDQGASAATAEAIAAAIDAALTDAALTLGAGACLYLRRESDVDYPEVDGADLYHHVGGMYRLITEGAP